MSRPLLQQRWRFVRRVVPLLLAAACLVVRATHGELQKQRATAVEPEVFYLRDDGGRLVPVPGFTYRDFVDLMRLRDGLPGLPQPPAAVLERVEVAGDLGKSDHGACAFTVSLQLRQTRAGWARLPLALAGFLLTDPPRHEGEGRFILDADPRSGGYEVWLEAGVDSQHTVTLVGTAAVERSPIAEAVRFDLPRATASLVRLRTPRVSPQVEVDPAGLVPQVVSAGGDEPGAVVECAGLSGSTTIRVGTRRTGERAGNALPHAVVESLVQIDGTIAATKATIRLEGLLAEMQEVRIGLPPGARLERVEAPATLVRVAGQGKTLEAVVRIQPDAGGQAIVELECERPIDATGAVSVEPLGFAVAGIPSWRQHGRTSLVVEGDWHVDWEDSGGTRRVDPPAAARRPGFVAAFAYDAQPASLPLQVRPRGSRVVVEPAYRYDIGATRISLSAKLRVIVRGAPVSRLVLGLDGWNVDDVGPPSVVDVAAVAAESGRLVIPFLQPLSGEATIEARCSMPLDRAATEMAWKLPVPRADLVGPAEVTIASDSDIEVLPEANAISGLVRQVAAPPRRGEVPRITYRLDGTDGIFAARRRFLPRRVDAAVVVQGLVATPHTRVEETIRLEVAHVPLEFVDLVVTRSVLDGGTLEIRQAGELLQPFEVSAAVDAAADAATLRVMLASPLLGAGDVSVAYSAPTPAVPAETTVAENLPLVLPADARIVRQSFALVATEQFAADVRGDSWTRDVAAPAAGPARVWVATAAQGSVPLALSLRPESGAGDTVVEAAWYETRLLPGRRDDIRTFAVTSTAPLVRLEPFAEHAPGGGSARVAVRVRVDGVVVTAAEQSDGSVLVPLPPPPGDSGRRGCVIEIEASRPRSSADVLSGIPGMPERIVLEPARFAAGTVLRRFYWEVRVEPDEHVVVPPPDWTSQQRWSWGMFGPESTPLVSREELAEWIAAKGQRRPAVTEVPLAERRVVYAGVGDPRVAGIWVAPMWLIVLVASGAALASGLAVTYRPSMRRVPVVVSIGAVVTLAAALAPDRAPLFGLAAFPGVALSVMAAVLRRVVDRPTLRPTPRSRPPFPPDSSTRLAPAASIVIAPSMIAAPDSVTAAGGTRP